MEIKIIEGKPNIDKLPPQVWYLGKSLLSYLFNISETEVQELNTNGGEINPLTLEHIQLLDKLITQIKTGRLSNQVLEWSDKHNLPHLRYLDGTHPFRKIRSEITGKAINRIFEDKVIEGLARMCDESYPFFLVPSNPRDEPFGCPIPSFYGSALSSTVNASIKEDKIFSKLFHTITEDELGTRGQFYTSNGKGGGIQLATLPETLIRSAFQSMKAFSKNSHDDFVSALERNVILLRNTLKGEETFIPIILCFEGVEIPNDIDVDLLGGRLKSITPDLYEVLPTSHKPSKTSTGYNGFVFYSHINYKILPTDPNFSFGSNEKWPVELADYSHINGIVSDLTLAFGLSSQLENPIAIKHISSLILDPIERPNSWRINRNQFMPHVKIDAANFTLVREWANRISESQDEKISIAKSRFILALNGRENPVDSFIDSIIALENLFGNKSEITVSVTSSVCILLESNVKNRPALYNNVKSLYGKRSTIIHGVVNIPTGNDAQELKNKALQYVMNCLKILYMDYPKLLSVKSSVRSKEIILGTHIE